MRDIAHLGKTIMCIVHQPSTDIFNLFDRIYLLAAGQEVYQVIILSKVSRGKKTTSTDILKKLGDLSLSTQTQQIS